MDTKITAGATSASVRAFAPTVRLRGTGACWLDESASRLGARGASTADIRGGFLRPVNFVPSSNAPISGSSPTLVEVASRR